MSGIRIPYVWRNNMLVHGLSDNIHPMLVISRQRNISPFYLSGGFKIVKFEMPEISDDIWELIPERVKHCINIINDH